MSGSARPSVLPEALPKFEDFPVKEIFKGKPADPKLSTPEARRFRTQLRVQARGGPDFAGHFTLARWGCGAGCVFVAVIDSTTGDVYFPLAFQDGLLTLDGGRRTITCHHSSDFQLDSELFVFQGTPVLKGSVEGKAGRYYYRWHDRKFTLLHYEPACPAFQL
jgi:hypothetical protein